MPDNTSTIGVDIGGTNLRAARISRQGEILERISEKSDNDPGIALARISEMIKRLDGPDVVAIGIGVPGRVDGRTRAVLSGGYLDLSRIAMAETVETSIGKPVVVDN